MHTRKMGFSTWTLRGWMILTWILLITMVVTGCQESVQQEPSTDSTEPQAQTVSPTPPEKIPPTQPLVEAPLQDQEPQEPVSEAQSPIQQAQTAPPPEQEQKPSIDPDPASLMKTAAHLDTVVLEPVTLETVDADPNGTPKISSDKMVYDFGQIGVMTKNTATFEIVNEGTAELLIKQISKCCGAIITINDIEVTEETTLTLLPGQLAEVKAIYQAPSSAGKLSKQFSILSNDPVTPALTLAIKGEVKVWVVCDPEQISLSLREENAGFPSVTVKSLDDNPFAVTQFWSTDNAVSLKVDPNHQATEMTFDFKVDLDKLAANPRGRIRFYLSREDVPAIECFYEVLKPYATNPATFLLFKADPAEPMHKKLWILDNYAQSGGYQANLEIESVKSVEHDMVKVVSQRPLDDGIELNLEITPPNPVQVKSHMFTDKLEIRLKGETEPIEVVIKGFYKAEVIANARRAFRDQQKAGANDQ